MKLANDVTTLMSKLATQIKEREEENLKAKENDNKLAIAVQGKELAEQAVLAEKSVW